ARDAFYQLVAHPVEAAGNLARLYVTVARNRASAAAGDPAANALADQAERLFANDRAIRARYETLNGGKWRHMMAQTHIGYTSWQQPDADVMPEVRRVAPGTPRTPVAVQPVPRAVEVDAAAFAAQHPAGQLRWVTVPQLGIAGRAVMPWPQTAAAQAPGKGPSLDYSVTLPAGTATVEVLAAPSLDVTGSGRRYAIAIDDAAPQVIDLWKGTGEKEWAEAVSNAVRVTRSTHRVAKGGRHRIRLWMIDPGVVVERLRVLP
ncbi:hypothetical protein DMC47_12340, partial [Nostoc sp. 3335mG]